MRNKLRRPLALLLSAAMTVTLWGTSVYAVAESGQLGTGLCEHHTAHTEDCGYTEGTPGTPCSHEHTEDCYALAENCVHEHTSECYPALDGDSVSSNTATPSEAEEAEPSSCTHECSEESDYITEELDCQHEHNEDCGYSTATEGTPCGYVCEICHPQDSGEAGQEPDGTGLCPHHPEHTEECGYAGEQAEIPCDLNCVDGDGDGVIDHAESCAYTPAQLGRSCGFVCGDCPVQEQINALPDAADINIENAEEIATLLAVIEEMLAQLTESERKTLDLTAYEATQAALLTLNWPVMYAADPVNKPTEGDGTEQSPYQITSAEELAWFRDTVNSGSADIHARLLHDID